MDTQGTAGCIGVFMVVVLAIEIIEKEPEIWLTEKAKCGMMGYEPELTDPSIEGRV